MKKIGTFLLGYIILSMAVQAHGLIYNPPLYDGPVPLSRGQEPFIGEILIQVPEPGVLLLLGAGLILLVILGIRKRKRTAAKGKNNP
jgi:PEP-CTERM motif